MKKLRYLLEYAGMQLALFILDSLPLSAGIALARSIGGLWFHIDRRRRKIAVNNIRRAKIAGDDAKCRAIAKASFQHFALIIVESLKAGKLITESNWRDIAQPQMSPEAEAILTAPGKGVIVASGHLGNWELSAQFASFMKPVVAIARDMNNPYTDRLMKKRNSRSRFQTTPKHGADARRLLSVLRKGEILAIMMDQHARDRGMMLDFLGTPASTHTSAAILHLTTRAPLCFGYCIRTGAMKFKLVLLPPIVHARTGNKDQDIRIIMETLNRHMEAAIRQHPEQYMWAHRRWRNAPANTGT